MNTLTKYILLSNKLSNKLSKKPCCLFSVPTVDGYGIAYIQPIFHRFSFDRIYRDGLFVENQKTKSRIKNTKRDPLAKANLFLLA